MSEMLKQPQYVIEGIILRRLHEKRIEGYTIETAKEIAEAVAALQSSADSAAALRLLAAEDERQSKLHELLETIREQIRLEVAPEHRPEGLFKNIQDAVYAMRGRTRLMDDAAITHVLNVPQTAPELTATCQKLLPGGIIDDATYAEIEDALDRADAPATVGGRWLKLHERIAALTAERPAASAEPQSASVFDKIEAFAKESAPYGYARDNATIERFLAQARVALTDARSQAVSVPQSPLQDAVEKIAKQALSTETDGVTGDYEYGYDECVRVARAALTRPVCEGK